MDDKTLDRFMDKVDKTGTCWLWKSCLNEWGYSRFSVRGKPQLAHRVSYEHFRESIPKGLVIDHLCRVPRCVNPEHLEVVTNKINLMRGISQSAINARKKVSICGKPFDYTKNGKRFCSNCDRLKYEKLKRRKQS